MKPTVKSIANSGHFIAAALRWRRRQREKERAARAAERAYSDYRAAAAVCAGCKICDLDFTNVYCATNPVGEGCIYKADGLYTTPGVGRRNCIVCGCDDFEF